MSVDKDSEEKLYNTLCTKRDTLVSIQDEIDLYDQKLANIRKTLNNIFGSAFPSSPSEISRQINQIMEENQHLLEYDEAATIQSIERAKSSYDKKVEDQALILHNQKVQLSSQTNECEDIKKESSFLDIEVKEKNAIIADLQKKIEGECSRIEQQRDILQHLTSTVETKAKHSEVVEKHNKLQNESAKQTSKMNLLKNIITTIREKNNTISKEIVTIDIQYRVKLVDKERLHFQMNFNDEMLKEAEMKNQKILNKNNLLAKQKQDEMAQLEQEIVQHRALYENLTKTVTDPADQLNTNLGDESQENMILQAEADLKKLNDECMTLEKAINHEKIEITTNGNKLFKFQNMEVKLLKDIQSKSLNESNARSQKNVESNFESDFESEELQSQQSSKTVPKVEVRAAPRDHIFLKPAASPRVTDTSRKLRRRRRANQPDTSPKVQLPDSSVSDWQATDADAEVDQKLLDIHFNALKVHKNW